jgi:hypothetical protein
MVAVTAVKVIEPLVDTLLPLLEEASSRVKFALLEHFVDGFVDMVLTCMLAAVAAIEEDYYEYLENLIVEVAKLDQLLDGYSTAREHLYFEKLEAVCQQYFNELTARTKKVLAQLKCGDVSG